MDNFIRSQQQPIEQITKIAPSGLQDFSQQQEIQFFRNQMQSSSNFNNQFNLQNQMSFNKMINEYKIKIQKLFSDLAEERGIQLYQVDLLDEANEGFKSIFKNEQLSPLLEAYEEENAQLKKEIDNLAKQVQKFISMIEILLVENNHIRNHINKKNNDITQLIQTIGINESEALNELNHKIHMLTEENNSLLKHLDYLKEFKDEYEKFQMDKELELQNIQDEFDKKQSDFEEAQIREKYLSEKVELFQPKLENLENTNLQQEKDLDEAYAKIATLENEYQQLKNQFDNVKKQSGEIEEKHNTEYDKLIQENNQFFNETKIHKQKIQQLESELQVSKTNNNNCQKQTEEYSKEIYSYQNKLYELNQNLNLEKMRANNSLNREQELIEQNRKLSEKLDKEALTLQQVKKQKQQLLDEHRQEIEEKYKKYEIIIDNLKQRSLQNLEEKEEELESVTKINNHQKQEIEKLKLELGDSNKEINQLQQKLQDGEQFNFYKQSQRAQMEQLQQSFGDQQRVWKEKLAQKEFNEAQLQQKIDNLEENISKLQQLLNNEPQGKLQQQNQEFQQKLDLNEKEKQQLLNRIKELEQLNSQTQILQQQRQNFPRQELQDKPSITSYQKMPQNMQTIGYRNPQQLQQDFTYTRQYKSPIVINAKEQQDQQGLLSNITYKQKQQEKYNY